MSQTEIIINVIPILASIMLGYFLTKSDIMKDSMVDALKR